MQNLKINEFSNEIELKITQLKNMKKNKDSIILSPKIKEDSVFNSNIKKSRIGSSVKKNSYSEYNYPSPKKQHNLSNQSNFRENLNLTKVI